MHLTGGLLEEAVNQGVREGYTEGLLRLSVVGDPLRRVNTNDNTPAVLHTRLVAGDKINIMVAPKGFGSENMSALKMFTPAATEEDIISFVADTVKRAGSCLLYTSEIAQSGQLELLPTAVLVAVALVTYLLGITVFRKKNLPV